MGTTGSLTAIHPDTNAEMAQRLDDVLRRSAHLMPLSLDRDRSPDAEPDSLFHRGWANAPMWANYADAHKGVCLVVDFPAVCEALDEHVRVKTSRYRNWGRINYVDRPIRIDSTGAFADRAPLDEALYNFLETRYTMSGLHMSKNTGWGYETELRLAVVDRGLEDHELDTPINLPLRNCIAAVIFGDAYLGAACTARAITAARGSNAPEFFQCRWIVGAPRLERV